MSKMRILTLDIETSPNLVYTWGLFNQNIGINQIVEPTRMICWAAKWLGKRKVIYRDFDDADFLTKIYELIDKADVVVTYNGIAFDMKHLNREFALADMSPPFAPRNIDLYRTVKKQFRFASNRLDHVAEQLLGKKKLPTDFTLWWDCLQENYEDAWIKMENYNKRDVRLTEELYLKLRPWITNHPNHGLFVDDQDNPVCRNCGSDHVVLKGQQFDTKNVFAYQRYKCMGCGAPLRGRQAVKGTLKNSPQVLTS